MKSQWNFEAKSTVTKYQGGSRGSICQYAKKVSTIEDELKHETRSIWTRLKRKYYILFDIIFSNQLVKIYRKERAKNFRNWSLKVKFPSGGIMRWISNFWRIEKGTNYHPHFSHFRNSNASNQEWVFHIHKRSRLMVRVFTKELVKYKNQYAKG